MDRAAVSEQTASGQVLHRELGVFGATMMGLGSIIGTGVFVSIGIAAGIAGPAIVLALVLAAIVATCNALNSAQLAANHPVSGGTYEYGYHFLNPWLGFIAGWMFVSAKTASAATAALGFSGYLLTTLGVSDDRAQVAVAVGGVALLTAVVLGGIRRSSHVNIVIVSVTLLTLVAFVLAGLPSVAERGTEYFRPFLPGSWADLFHATALMFVAYTGYGRIATLGEEVHEPRRTIPRAIIATLILSALLYVTVAMTGIGAAGAERMYAATREQAAPLEVVSRQFTVPGVHRLIAIGAITAMLGVLLNLILGLSRVLLAMGRRGDMPRGLAAVNHKAGTPHVAIVVVGVLTAGLALIGSVKTTWSFSAFTVLIYYAITNLAALRLSAEQRLYSPIFAWVGLAACLFLAFWVEWQIWSAGLALIAAGVVWHLIAGRLSRRPATGG